MKGTQHQVYVLLSAGRSHGWVTQAVATGVVRVDERRMMKVTTLAAVEDVIRLLPVSRAVVLL
jgi:hypothetical protein